MREPSKRKRTRLSPQARRNQILDEAARLVLGEGLHAVTMERLAREVGVSKALVYNYFSDRDRLLAALLEREEADLRDRGFAAALEASDYRELIRQTTRLFLEQSRDRGALIAALLADPSVARLLEAGRRADRDSAFRYFVRATRREFELPLPLTLIVVPILSALTDQAGKLVSQGEADVDTATEVVVELITGGLANLRMSLDAHDGRIGHGAGDSEVAGLDDQSREPY